MAKPSAPWVIIAALAAQLATITVANGYHTDSGANIWTSDNQRTSDDALGFTVYSGDIDSAAPERERPAKPVRDFTVYVEAHINADLDNAHAMIHAVIEDFEACMEAWIKTQAMAPLPGVKPLRVDHISIETRPEGLPVIGMLAHVAARYFR